MATGKKALDIFTPTVGKRPDIGVEVAERIEGRPRATEPYQKVTVTLYERQILNLDKVALVIRERTGQAVSRAELIRAERVGLRSQKAARGPKGAEPSDALPTARAGPPAKGR